MARNEGTTILLATHNLPEAERLCNIVAILRAGELVACGAPAALLQPTATTVFQVAGSGITDSVLSALKTDTRIVACSKDGEELILTLETPNQLPEILQSLRDQGVTVMGVRKAGASLEDAYLALMKSEKRYGS